MKVAICVPTHDSIPAMFSYDLANLTGFTAATAVASGQIEGVGLTYVTSTYIHRARQQLAEIALESGADYMLWLDSDMRFPKDALLRLLARNVPFVGINYSTRGVPPNYVAISDTGLTGGVPTKCATLPDSTGIEEVEAVGFGVTLMDTAILKRLPDPTGPDGPWFNFAWDPNRQQFVGEDVYFCRLVQKHGIPVHVDHDLSKECAHIGSFEYRLEHVQAAQEEE